MRSIVNGFFDSRAKYIFILLGRHTPLYLDIDLFLSMTSSSTGSGMFWGKEGIPGKLGGIPGGMKFGGIGGIPGRRGGKPIGGGKLDAGGTPRAGKFGGGTPGGIFIGGIPGGGPLIGGIGIGGIADLNYWNELTNKVGCVFLMVVGSIPL